MRRRIDPGARRVLLAIAGGRIAIGVGALAATRPALAATGFAAPGAQARTLARVAGSRDVALGLLTLAGAWAVQRLSARGPAGSPRWRR